ncbi:type B 50S ribosomal protein L31 [Pseudomonas oryzihabitans]|uniref:type B 50S ribosomal protein L31 n=1 Tax=Pseudomonas oryzihabitans TaxID=47885 RepID=UPI000EC0AB6A|nr:type B 50S ribosomal protein L31 [Pseudomonas oryzihabitans]HCV77551.1 50S ribosomal protein L31 [Pseudomonas sp.]
MKPGIHPNYRPVLFHDTTSDTYFLIRSTAESDRTQEYEGETYPYISLDVSSSSHPIYTGEQRQMKVEGRVSSFNKKFAGFPGGNSK